MSRASRNALIGILGLILLVAPMLVRFSLFGDRGSYTSPEIENHINAATPIPTVTALAQRLPASLEQKELRSGPVVVDLAHFNFLDITKFQPLSSALAQRGIGTRFWLPVGINAMEITSFLDFPDQSDKLAAELKDASALVIVSPFFLWSSQEIELVRNFVADGGRLLLISDPDSVGDLAQTMNLLAEPYGLVFNDDYLYNTERNDENFTYTFQGEFLDRAADLAENEIVFYGARSIVGSVAEQIRSSDTTLSSSRTGLTSFTTVAIAGLTANETEERVLAMSDFDVLSEPFVDRYDNVEMLNFVADFLAGGGRSETLVDFPGSLGKEVALVYGTQETVDAKLLEMSAKLQQRLIRSGRDLQLAQSAPLSDGQIISSTQLLTGPLASLVLQRMADVVEGLTDNDDVESNEPSENTSPDSDEASTGDNEAGNDDASVANQDESRNGQVAVFTPTPTAQSAGPFGLATQIEQENAPPLPTGNVIYLADFETAGKQEMLLADVGFTLIQVARTPTPTPTPLPTATPTPTAVQPTPTVVLPIDATAPLTGTESLSGTSTIPAPVPITGTAAITDSLSSTTVEGADTSVGERNEADAAEPTTSSLDDELASDDLTDTASITETTPITSSVEISPTATAIPEPVITAYLVSDSGLQLLASETVLIVQQERADEEKLIAVLGSSSAAINAGVQRLLEGNFVDCIVEDDQIICPFVDKNAGNNGGSGSSSGGGSGNDSEGGSGSDEGGTENSSGESTDGTPTPIATIPGGTVEPDATPSGGETPEPDSGPISPQEAKIIVVDDNAKAEAGEPSEAEFYVDALTAMGAAPALWSIADSGPPPTDLIVASDWLIWSSAGYAEGGPAVADLDPLFEVLNAGGRITISSQNTFFGQTQDPPSQLSDIYITTDVPALTQGLPPDPILLAEGVPPIAPLQANTEENPTLSVVFRRGPTSENPDEPVLFVLVDDEDPEATGARLMVMGMSIMWVSDETGDQLLSNMMTWMLE